MELDSIRPIITGALGGLLSLWLLRKWARFVPSAYESKSADELIVENRPSILVANVLFFGAIAVGIYLFKAGYLKSNSWPGFALIVGAAIMAPLLAITLMSIGKGRERLAQAFVAFAIAERTPLPVLFGIVIIGVVCLASGLGGIAW